MDVPYRCPRCGDGKTFPVLSELKQHLTVEHSYVPTPRKRVQVFNGKNSGRYSPLLQSFHDEGMRLERELQQAKDLEMNNKLKRYGEDGEMKFTKTEQIPSRVELVKQSMVSFQDEQVKNMLSTVRQDGIVSMHNQLNMTRAFTGAEESLSNVEKAAETSCTEQRGTIQKLNEELKGKEEGLKNSEKELERLREEQNQLLESAEILARKTNEESQRLSEELEAKEFQLGQINSQLAELRQNTLEEWAAQQRERLSWKSEKDAKNMMMERNLIQKQRKQPHRNIPHNQSPFHHPSNDGRTSMNSQGNRNFSLNQTEKGTGELDILSQELRKMQRDAVQKIQEKDKELLRAKRRSEKLESDRLVLLQEMENLLSKANTDNEKLKMELKKKDDDLKRFNTNLEDAKREQSKLVGETFELYREADKNIAKLKEMLALKDFQLKAADEKLNQFQIANEQLLAESESIAHHADEKGNIMASMLETTEHNLQEMEKELNQTKFEKEKLQEETQTLKQEVAERSRSLEELQQEVLLKEQELEKTNDDLKTLQTFLQTTAAKESVARKELEKFIMELIERADTAEKELRTLRRQVRAASLSRVSDESQSVHSTHIPVSLHNTLTEDVIHTTSSHIAPEKAVNEFDGRRSDPIRALNDDNARSRGRHATTDKKMKSSSLKMPKHSHQQSQHVPQGYEPHQQNIDHHVSFPSPGYVQGHPQNQVDPSPGLQGRMQIPYEDQISGHPSRKEESYDNHPIEGDFQGQPLQLQGQPVQLNHQNRQGYQVLYQVNQQAHPSSQGKNVPTQIAGGHQTAHQTSDGKLAQYVSEPGAPSEIKDKEVKATVDLYNGDTPDQGSDNKQTVCGTMSNSELKPDPKVEVSDMGIQTETAEPIDHQTASTGEKDKCENCQPDFTQAELKANKQENMSKESNMKENIERNNTPPERHQQNVCMKCTDLTTKLPQTVPVPIYSSTPKKARKSRTTNIVCRHCYHNVDEGSTDSDMETEQKRAQDDALRSARSVVLARIMADETSRPLSREQRLWDDLETPPRWRGQTYVPRTRFYPGLNRKGLGLSGQFDRIRHPQTMQYLYNDDPGNRIISGTSRDDLFDSGHPRPFSVEPEKRRTLSTVSKPSSGLGVEARNSDKSDSLSHRIDKLEKMISENRSRSNEKLEKVLNEVIADSDKISTREEIRKLRESIRPRLNPVRDRTSEITGHKVTANKHNASTSLGHMKQISSLKNNELGTSPKSSDSYVGLPSSRTYDGPQLKESTSQSFSTYRSTEPGLIIRNDFYGERVPGIFSAQPERPAHSPLPSFQLQHPGQSINYPQGNFQGLGQFGVLDRSHQLQMAPQYIQSSTGPHYEHFPHALYPQPVSTYPGTTPRQQFGVRGEQSWKEEDRESGYLFDVKRSRDSGVPKKLTRKFDSPNLSTESELSEGLELSVDENGILWDEDQADTGVSEDLDSFRLSPSGSETAGDFDSSLLLSGSGSQPLPGKTDGHRQKLDEIAETDEESSYCGLPVVNRRSQDQIGDRQLGRDLTDSAGNGVLRTNKGGMVSDIVSVRDKMMKYLDEGDLKERKPNLRNEEDSVHLRETANLASSRLSHGVDNECLNNSHALQQASKPSSYNSSNVGKDRQITKQAYQMESSDDNTSSSYAPLKLSASKSRFKKSESFDLDAGHSDTKNTPSKYTTVGNNASAHGDKQEVVEESIQPQTKTSVRLPLDISRKLNLLSSSSESFEQLPRRRPVVKKRTVKNIKTKEDTESLDAKDKDQDNKQPITNNSQPKDALTTDRSPIMLSEKNTKEERIPDLPQAVNPKALESFENRDSVLGTSIGSDQVDDAQFQEAEPSKESSKDMLAQREESGLTSSLDSLDDLDKYEGVPLKKAEPLRLTFADEGTSDDEEQSKGSPVTVPVASPPACREESTDFDFESDLERFGTPMQIKPGLKGRSKKNKVLTHKKARGSSSRKLSIPKVNADVMPTESSDAASDVSKVTRQKHEAARRRRVALFCVFRYLDTRTLSQMALVSREWRHVSRHPELWKKVELKNERVSSSFLVTISQWCSRLRQITLEGLQCRQRRSDETLEQYQQNMRGCLESGLEELFKSCQNSLVSLQIIACGNHLTNKCLWLVSCYCRLLEELHYISSTDPVTAEVLWAIGGGCPGVTTLIVPPLYPCLKPKTFNNKCLVLIAKFYPDLLKLGIGGQEIGIGGLLPLVQGCQRLQYLELDHVSELTSDDATALCRAGLRQLSVLEINATPISPDAVKQIYKSCRHLKRLRILLDFQDYFENATKKNKQEYKKKIQKLQDLLKQPGLGNVLKIQAAPVD